MNSCGNCPTTPHICKRFDKCCRDSWEDLERDLNLGAGRWSKLTNRGAETPWLVDPKDRKHLAREIQALERSTKWLHSLGVVALLVAIMVAIGVTIWKYFFQ